MDVTTRAAEGGMSMGVYINMEMPKEGFVEILIRDDGTVQQTGQSYRIDGTDYYTPYVGEMPTIYKAVPVPPHGRLGDLDDFAKRMKSLVEKADNDGFDLGAVWYSTFVQHIELTPTIIPAEEAGA
jgi:hypothetical protein